MPVERWPRAGKAVSAEQHRICNPPQTAPGLGPPRTQNGAWVQICLLECRTNNEYRIIPTAALCGGGQQSRAAPGRGDPLLLSSLLLELLQSFSRQSCSLRTFLRARLRASAAFTRFFSPGFR